MRHLIVWFSRNCYLLSRIWVWLHHFPDSMSRSLRPCGGMTACKKYWTFSWSRGQIWLHSQGCTRIQPLHLQAPLPWNQRVCHACLHGDWSTDWACTCCSPSLDSGRKSFAKGNPRPFYMASRNCSKGNTSHFLIERIANFIKPGNSNLDILKKTSRRKKLKTQGKNSIAQGKNLRSWQILITKWQNIFLIDTKIHNLHCIS